jgi:hypothetical protein
VSYVCQFCLSLEILPAISKIGILIPDTRCAVSKLISPARFWDVDYETGFETVLSGKIGTFPEVLELSHK